jgi:hypothetical protein
MDFASFHFWAFWLLTALAAYLGSYAAEKGKRRAAKEDSDQIRNELAKTTEQLKVIEAKIASEVWDRQWRQDQKLKIYTQILRAINDYSIWLSDVSESWKFGKSASRPASTMKKEPLQTAEEFHAAYSVAPLFLIKGSLDLLERAKPAFYYHSSPFPDAAMKGADEHWELLREVHRELALLARQDLARSTPSPNDP